MFERKIDFNHERSIYCEDCNKTSVVDESWLRGYFNDVPSCPKCLTRLVDPEKFVFASNDGDVMRNAHKVKSAYWYHTSNDSEWPRLDFSPESSLTPQEIQHYELNFKGGVKAFARRKREQALHVGTYEAAIENMLRHMGQTNAAMRDFYLYRVVLRQECKISEHVHREPPSAWGATEAASILNDDLDVYRYVNNVEDKSGISLALTRRSIAQVQMIPISVRTLQTSERVEDLVRRLELAELTTIERGATPSTIIKRKLRQLDGHSIADDGSTVTENQLSNELVKVINDLADGLPQFVAQTFRSLLLRIQNTTEIRPVAKRLDDLCALIVDPLSALRELDQQPWRQVSGSPTRSI